MPTDPKLFLGKMNKFQENGQMTLKCHNCKINV